MNIQGWFPLGLSALISLQSKSLLQHHSSKAWIPRCLALFIVQHSHPYLTTGKIIALTRWTFVCKVMSLLLNILSRLVIAFLLRNKHLSISLEPKKRKSITVSIVSPSICHEVMGPDAMNLGFWMLSFKPVLSGSSFTFIKRFFSFSLISAIRVVSSAYLRLLIFLPAILIPHSSRRLQRYLWRVRIWAHILWLPWVAETSKTSEWHLLGIKHLFLFLFFFLTKKLHLLIWGFFIENYFIASR